MYLGITLPGYLVAITTSGTVALFPFPPEPLLLFGFRKATMTRSLAQPSPTARTGRSTGSPTMVERPHHVIDFGQGSDRIVCLDEDLTASRIPKVLSWTPGYLVVLLPGIGDTPPPQPSDRPAFWTT